MIVATKLNLRLYALLAILVCSIVELFSFMVIRFILLPREPAFFFQNPEPTSSGFQRYMNVRDPLLGWPARKLDKNGMQVIESRPIPVQPSSIDECVSLYGDSFTYGDEVTHSEAWSNVLSTRLNCRVGNYGIGGYGTDQAYLRFLMNERDAAKIVILGIFPENVLRNVNRYRYLLDARTVFSLKPRFIFENDRLRLVEMPVWSWEEFLATTKAPEEFLEHEVFLPDSVYGPVSLTFPYSWKIVKLVLSDRVRSAMLGYTSWEVFFRDDHPTQALRITSEIADLFSKACRSRGKIPLVLIYPTARSFKQFREAGVLITRPLIDNLEQREIPYIDLHEEFAKRLDGRRFCDLLTQSITCAGHFNADGNVLVAEAVYAHFVKSNLIE